MTPAERRAARLARLNAHIDRVARICAIGDACCREIESLREPQPAVDPPAPTAFDAK